MTDPTPRERLALRAERRAMLREVRDEKIRTGRLTPQTHREMRLWRAGLAERFPANDERPNQ